MNRAKVYELIDGEREYQLQRPIIKNAKFPYRDEDHSIADWLIYMEWHLERAKLYIYNLDFTKALSEIRKVTALGNETPPRNVGCDTMMND